VRHRECFAIFGYDMQGNERTWAISIIRHALFPLFDSKLQWWSVIIKILEPRRLPAEHFAHHYSISTMSCSNASHTSPDTPSPHHFTVESSRKQANGTNARMIFNHFYCARTFLTGTASSSIKKCFNLPKHLHRMRSDLDLFPAAHN
jgi:hypothetical protein